MTTEISDAARDLADSFMPRLLSKSCHRDCGDITNAELAAHIQSALNAARNSALEDAARKAESACLVPPDGGCPSPTEVAVCKTAAKAIRAMKVQI